MAAPNMDLAQEVGESSSPPRTFAVNSGRRCSDFTNDVYNRFLEIDHPEAVRNPEFRHLLESHFRSLPPSYALDVNMDKVDDVLVHNFLLAQAKISKEQPVFNLRVLEHISVWSDVSEKLQLTSNVPNRRQLHDGDEEAPATTGKRQELTVRIHEVIFSTVNKPKVLSQLSAVLSDIGLNIREAHVFSTTDGCSLDVFLVDGWHGDTDGLYEAIVEAIERSEGSWFFSQSAVEKAFSAQASGDLEIDRRLLKIGEKITSGSSGDLYRGTYLGQDVAIKIPELINEAPAKEFAKELEILRAVQHKNVVRFIGACTKSPNLCILTEYMPGGNLYDYLREHHNNLKLSQLLKFALGVSEGMEYLHHNDIIHRDLKTANLLLDSENVVKIADFGIARFQSQGGAMTQETGTYKWMAPEILRCRPYDQRADVYSFAIVIWELVTAKMPYSDMTPLQAALAVRGGLRPKVPQNMHPKLADLMGRCWDANPAKRPPFSEITIELGNLLHEAQSSEASSSGS